MGLSLHLFGDDRLKGLENSLEDLIKHSPPRIAPIANSSDAISSDVLSKFIEDPEKDDNKPFSLGGNVESTDEVTTLLEKITVPPERTNRYRVYEEIYRSVPMIKRIKTHSPL